MWWTFACIVTGSLLLLGVFRSTFTGSGSSRTGGLAASTDADADSGRQASD